MTNNRAPATTTITGRVDFGLALIGAATGLLIGGLTTFMVDRWHKRTITTTTALIGDLTREVSETLREQYRPTVNESADGEAYNPAAPVPVDDGVKQAYRDYYQANNSPLPAWLLESDTLDHTDQDPWLQGEGQPIGVKRDGRVGVVESSADILAQIDRWENGSAGIRHGAVQGVQLPGGMPDFAGETFDYGVDEPSEGDFG